MRRAVGVHGCKMVCDPDDLREEGCDEAEESKKRHGGCGHTQPLEGKSLQPDERLMTPSEVYTTFKKTSDSDLHLNHARPEWMVLTVIPVPPLPVWPSIAVDGGAMRSEDDPPYKLGGIPKASVNIRRCEQEGAPAHVILELEQLL
ncbi:DNA-directed RNA polymerase II core subunit rpo21 [Marasmius tenuissimus]|nr:DNA-directed RNA polymerase II core subunit rpo21 [Marasmius tenuissimus]